MNDIDLAWLAGLIEGEGSFLVHLVRHKFYTIAIQVVMTDEDVVRKCLSVSGMGTVTKPRQRNPKWKPIWVWRVHKRTDVVALMNDLYPYMGKRRRAQIDACLAVNEEHPYQDPAQYQKDKTHCPKGHPYSGDNLYSHKGKRHCKACRMQAKIRYRQKQRTAS